MEKQPVSRPVKFIATNCGLMRCTVPEFDPQKYRGLKNGIGITRLSSKHNPINIAARLKKHPTNKP